MLFKIYLKRAAHLSINPTTCQIICEGLCLSRLLVEVVPGFLNHSLFMVGYN